MQNLHLQMLSYNNHQEPPQMQKLPPILRKMAHQKLRLARSQTIKQPYRKNRSFYV